MSRFQITSTLVIALSLVAGQRAGWTQATRPIMPSVVETPLPAPVTLPLPASGATEPTTQPLTATEAALIALQRQPSITVAEMGVVASKGRLQQTQSGLYPTLAVSGGYSDQVISATNGGGQADGFTTTATVRQLLFDFQRTRNQVRQATAQQQAARANLTRAQSDLVFQVKQTYYAYTQQLRLVSVNESNLRNRREHLALAQARVQAGVGLPIDVVRAETAVADAILSLNLAQNTAAVTRVTLAQLMGLDPRTPLQTSEQDEPALNTDDFEALQTTALAQRPEIAQAQANLLAARYGVNIAKSTNAPSLIGTAGYGMRGDNFPPTDDTLALGLSVQWSAFDAGNTHGKVTEAQANQQAAQAQLSSAKLAVISDLSQAYLNEKTALQRLVTANAQVTNAQEVQRLAQGRYNAGLGIFLDVLDAQATLVTAQTNLVNTQSAVNQARAALARALNSDPAMTAVNAIEQ